jgi:formate dehydrogenase subunit delta
MQMCSSRNDIAVSSDQHNAADHLVQMANDIGNFFRAEPDREDAIAGIANHISKFWTKRMRQKMAAHGEAGLDELPREALRRLAESSVAVPKEHAGGDAG